MNLPTFLTWLRILAVPLIVVIYAYQEPSFSTQSRNFWATVVFVGAALTDALDGYLARKLNQTSPFGAFLDPVADKLMVCAALVILVELGRVSTLIALVIIGREIAISALREWMAQVGQRSKVAVSSIGKFKTIAQMVAIPFLLYQGTLFGVIDTGRVGVWLIWIATALTIWSMLIYFRLSMTENKSST